LPNSCTKSLGVKLSRSGLSCKAIPSTTASSSASRLSLSSGIAGLQFLQGFEDQLVLFVPGQFLDGQVAALLEEVHESQLGLELTGSHGPHSKGPEVEGVDMPPLLGLRVDGLGGVREDRRFPT
jgi:hypothetical protein